MLKPILFCFLLLALSILPSECFKLGSKDPTEKIIVDVLSETQVNERIREFNYELEYLDLLDVGAYIREFFVDDMTIGWIKNDENGTTIYNVIGKEALFAVNNILTEHVTIRYLYAVKDYESVETYTVQEENGEKLVRDEGYLVNRYELKGLSETHCSVTRDWKKTPSGWKIVRMNIALTNERALLEMGKSIQPIIDAANEMNGHTVKPPTLNATLSSEEAIEVPETIQKAPEVSESGKDNYPSANIEPKPIEAPPSEFVLEGMKAA